MFRLISTNKGGTVLAVLLAAFTLGLAGARAQGPVAPSAGLGIPKLPGTQPLIIPDSERNWVFTGMNDLFGPKPGDGLNLTDFGLDPLKNRTAVDQYYDNRRNASAAPATSAGQTVKEAAPASGFNPMGTLFPEQEKYIRGNIVPQDRFSSGGDKVGGTVKPPDPKELLKEQQRRTEEFRRLLDPRLPALSESPAGLFDAVKARRDEAQKSISPVRTAVPVAPPPHSSLNPVLGAVDPTFNATHPLSLMDPTDRALGINPASRPAVAAPKPIAPFSSDPMAEIPKRKF